MAYGTRGHVRRSRAPAGGFRFADELRSWRHKRNLSQSEAALKLQISKRTLQEWEQRRAEPEGLARIAIQNLVR
jgi:DNA-binding transcriptional regulator YiaG